MLDSTIMEILDNAKAQDIRIITAESLTCGRISAALANIAGASSVVNGGFSVYQDEMKESQLGVPGRMLLEFTAVSAQVADAMARGALKKTDCSALGHKASNLSIAVTGYAGSPCGFAPESDAGLVYIAIARQFATAADPEVDVYEHRFEGDRESVRQQTLDTALGYVHDMICA